MRQAVVGWLGLVFCIAMRADANEYVETPHSQMEIMNTHTIAVMAERWGISEQEYKHYLDIVNGPLGRWNKNIDPLFALGIYADTEAEQRKYAELLARQEYALAMRTIEFERAYRAAFKKLFPEAGILDQELLKRYYRHNRKNASPVSGQSLQSGSALKPGDRFIYFANKDDCAVCAYQVRQLMALMGKHKKMAVDIYVRGAHNKNEIISWAGQHHINKKLVGRQLTLNADNGLYQRIVDSSVGAAGQLFLSRGGQLYKVEPAELGL